MTPSQFDQLVQSVELQAAQRRGRYRSILAGMALLGYGYISTILIVLFCCIVFLGWAAVQGGTTGILILKNVGIALVAVLAMVGRAMWVKLDPPAGIEIHRTEAPRLFTLIEETRRRVRGPRVHQVLITEDFNAAVVQHPRYGLFGFPKNYLILGLPLMQALSPEEFQAVLAHEFGHLAKSHGQFGAWIYRVRAGWSRLAGALLQERHWASFLFVPFFSWYAPRFAAYSFVEARAQECEADRLSAMVTSRELAASALLRLRIQAHRLELFWDGVFKKAELHDMPVDTPYSEMAHALKQSHPKSEANAIIGLALRVPTNREDTHPCLADRLKALGVAPDSPAAWKHSAAEELLGDASHKFTEYFDQVWRERVEPWWKERHREIGVAKERVQMLRDRIGRGEGTREDDWELAAGVDHLGLKDEAIASYAAFLKHDPDHMASHLALGRLLLSRGDEAGIRHYERAIEQDQILANKLNDQIAYFLRSQERHAEADSYSARALKSADILELATAERSRVTASDEFMSHGLEDGTVEKFASAIRRFGDLKNAWLVQKKLAHFPERPFYVLGVIHNEKWWSTQKGSTSEYLVDQIVKSVDFPGETYVVALYGSYRRLKPRFAAIAGSQIV